MRRQKSSPEQTVREKEDKLSRKISGGRRFYLPLSQSLMILPLTYLLCIISIPFSLIAGICFFLCDVTAKAFSLWQREKTLNQPVPHGDRKGVSVIIPNWNGRELLALTLPTITRAVLKSTDTQNEIIVVDNSSTDGSIEYVHQNFPGVRVVSLPTNQGFAAAANIGVKKSRNGIILLLNNDMVVQEDFLEPLLEVFHQEPHVFGVSCHIYFWDDKKPRWETGKAHGRFHNGFVDIFHLYEYSEDWIYPIFYAGGGASAYDKAKFLALGGFDEKNFTPVYIEDVDLGYRAWKRGWPSLFQPKSVVYHKHRATTSRLYSERDILVFFKKNLIFLIWKNVTQPRLLLHHFFFLPFHPYLMQKYEGLEFAFSLWFCLLRQFPRSLSARFLEYGGRVLKDEDIFLASRHRDFYRELFN